MRRVAPSLVVLSLFVAPRVASAEPKLDPSELTQPEREKARSFADTGMRRYEEGNYAGALEAFEQAEELVFVPTITVQHGRALERLGRWVDAIATYQRAANAEIKPSSPWQHRTAKADATKALAELAPRIPSLKIVVRQRPPGSEVLIDGRQIPSIDEPVLVDPGKHVVEARSPDGEEARGTVEVQEGGTQTVELVLTPKKFETREDPLWDILAWSGVAFGGACLVTSLGTGVAAGVAKGELDASCPAGRCGPDDWDKVDRYDGLRYTAGVTLFVGLAFAGAGTTLFFVRPPPEEVPARAVSLRSSVGPSHAFAAVEVGL